MPILTQRRSLFTFSRTGFFIVFLTQGAGKTVTVTHDFPVHEPFTLGAVCMCVSLTDLWFGALCFSLSRLRMGSSFPFSDRVSSRCFSVEDRGGCFPHVFVAVVSPTLWAIVGYE